MAQTVGSDSASVAEKIPGTTAFIGQVLHGVNYVTSELPETHTRRTLRDRLGMSAGIAQDIGVVVGLTTGAFLPGQAGKVVTSVGRVAMGAPINTTRMMRASTTLHRARSAVVKGVNDLKSVWSELPLKRGEIIEQALGQNLPKTFRTIDRICIENKVATSIKSIDLHAPTYQNPSVLKTKLQGYVDKMAGFTRGELQGHEVNFGENFTKRALDLAIPEGASAIQQQILQETVRYASEKGVMCNVIVFA